VLKYLDSTSLSPLSSCNSHRNSSVITFLQQSLHLPLIPAVLAAALSEQQAKKQASEYAECGYRSRSRSVSPGKAAAACSRRAVVWLCSKAGSTALADRQLAAAVLRVPKLSRELACTLIQSGLRVSYADVLAAAKQGVRGVESWVSAAYTVAKEDGAASGMPGLAIAICRLVSTQYSLLLPVIGGFSQSALLCPA
jgi:hypothetical protein